MLHLQGVASRIAIVCAINGVFPSASAESIANSLSPLSLGQLSLAQLSLAQPSIAQLSPGRLSPPVPTLPLPERIPALPAPALPDPNDRPLPVQPADEVPSQAFVSQIDVLGSTVFSATELAEVTAPYVNREVTFTELLQARSAITQLYVSRGYITSGAFLPPQTLENGRVTIQVIEGSLESIQITGTRRLNPSYLRRRLALVTAAPLNQTRLLAGLQLLQLNPLIQTLSADLQSGTRLGSSVLQVAVQEADSFHVRIGLNNGRSPSVGSFRRQIQMEQANLTGLGDRLSVEYLNTDGSNEVNGSYEIPLNPRNGTLRIALGRANSRVIQPPFDRAQITVPSRYYEIGYRQPLFQSPTQEFALGFTASRQESQTLVEGEGVPLAPEADADGQTRVSALRFSQEWTERSSQHVVAVRSQLSLGVDWLGATVNRNQPNNQPDSRFLAWRGQGQWVRQLAPDLLLLLRGDLQVSNGPLVGLEQFGLGGAQSVRGYRQDALLSRNGALVSTEARLPLLRLREGGGLLQIAPFLDLGSVWPSPERSPSTLVGIGLGLLWQQDNFSARIDWAVPLVPVTGEKRSWQENGLYFSVIYSAF